MGIPPHAARLAGAWATQSASAAHQSSRPDPGPELASDLRPGAEAVRGSTSRPRRNRSHRITSRILHPLHRHA